MAGLVPDLRWTRPTLNHEKTVWYIDFPVVHNATVTNEPFYTEWPFTVATTDLANTTISKWCDGTWVPLTGLAVVDVIDARGFFAVTTASAASVIVTEHFNQS